MTDPTRHQQLMELDVVTLCTQILEDARNELYLNMHFLDISLSCLGYEAAPGSRWIGTDGWVIYYDPETLLALYKRGRTLVNRVYLHMVLHCLFCHHLSGSRVSESQASESKISGSRPDGSQSDESQPSGDQQNQHLEKSRDTSRDYWDLACDIAMESVLDGMYQKCIHRPQSPFRRETYLRLRKTLRVLTAEGIYQELLKMNLTEKQQNRLMAEFRIDDHSRWYEEDSSRQTRPRQNTWKDNREKLQTEMESFASEAAEDSQSLLEQVQIENRERYDYKKFLRKFSVLKEEMQVDEDSFDYAYYTYGMSLYGNMPLIEPLESKEVHRIEDFVIVIDTSMSCSGELVRRFLEETYAVLSESESYFKKINIHVIQCDDKVQTDQVITSREEMDEYMREFTITGKGGTDFRPAFEHVNQLRRQGAFRNLRGLLYFTDGEGIYPVKRPVYDTAFVFMKDRYTDISVPPWAIKLILEPEDMETKEGKQETGWEAVTKL